MFWHVLWIVGCMVGSATVIDIARAALHRRRLWAGITVDAEARRLERERDLAPFLPEAQREVDRFLPGTPAIARVNQAPIVLAKYPVDGAPYQPPSDLDDEPVVIDGKTLPAPNDKRWELSAGGEGIWFWMPAVGKGLFVYPDGDVRLSDHGTWFKHKAAAVLCKKVSARLKPAAEKEASDALAAAIKNVETAARKKKV